MARLVSLFLGLSFFSLAPAYALPDAQIIPHKALYEMSMEETKKGSALNDVTGTVVFDWDDVCDSWTQQQFIAFQFSYVDGASSKTKSTIMTSESKDGQNFTFYVKRKIDGEDGETLKGRAELEQAGGTAQFALPPETKDLTLPSGTIFPTQHILMMIHKALAGEKLFTSTVFDGAQQGGAGEISSFIGGRLGAAQKGEVSDVLLKDPLLSGPAWPVRMAFYEPGSKQSEPDYEMDMLLQANGIARSISIDYGDFVMKGRLAKIEKGTKLACPSGK